MTTFQKCAFGLAVAALLLAAWMGRYAIVTAPRGDGPATAYVLDRFTGNVTVMFGSNSKPVQPAQ